MLPTLVTREQRELMAILDPHCRDGLIEALIDYSIDAGENSYQSDLALDCVNILREMSDEEYEALDLYRYYPED